MTYHDAPRFVLRHFLPLASNETMKSEPGGLSQGAVHPGLPARPAGLEPGHHVLIEAQRDGNLGVFDLGPSAHVPAHGVGQGRKASVKGRA